jgi:hypothetical protein
VEQELECEWDMEREWQRVAVIVALGERERQRDLVGFGDNKPQSDRQRDADDVCERQPFVHSI